MNTGLLQGSVFLVYVNDISDSLLCLTRLLAVDSSLFYSAFSIYDILSLWSKQWLISFKSLKTETVLFTHEQYEHPPNLFLESAQINFVTDHKH